MPGSPEMTPTCPALATVCCHISASNALGNSAELWLENQGQRNWSLEANRQTNTFDIVANTGSVLMS